MFSKTNCTVCVTTFVKYNRKDMQNMFLQPLRNSKAMRELLN